VLVDHGRTWPAEPLPPVPGVADAPCCECVGEPADVTIVAGRYRPSLARAPLVHAQVLPAVPAAATATLVQDARAAVPSLVLTASDGLRWQPRTDLLASGPDDRDVVIEIDNLGLAHLRFGDGELGRQPDVGAILEAVYRTGGGRVGNVGAEAISRLVLVDYQVDGVEISVRNPLAAAGGLDPEPIADAQLFAPGAFREVIERAITADDYAAIAARDPRLQGASARLVWTGSWYEADVALDPLGAESASPALVEAVTCALLACRRMGHDLHVLGAAYVPLKLGLDVCALPGYERGHVLAALLRRFGRTRDAFFDPDQQRLGEGIRLSRVIAAAQAVPGVECVTVCAFHRLFAVPNHEIDNGLLPLAANEIAQLDNDPDHPERGVLDIRVRGGR
jgi:predicted phage baseplate assembly protein